MAIVHLFILIVFVVTINLHGSSADGESTRPINPEEIGGDIQGDIKIPPLTRSLASLGNDVRWPNNTLPYYISTGYTIAQQNAIITAMRLLESLTAINDVPCITFRPNVTTDGNYYIFIFNGNGCSSYVGRYTGLDLNRTVSLQYPGCFSNGTIMHELMHNLGFQHEQSRPDRDDYVQINYENIQSGEEGNFDKYDYSQVTIVNTTYDYGSVMHYPQNAFSANGLDTIVPIRNTTAILGQRVTLSPTDIEGIRIFYDCYNIAGVSDTSTTTSTTTTSTTTSTTTTSTTTSTDDTTTTTTSTTTSTDDTTTTTTSATTSTTDITTTTTSTTTSTTDTTTTTTTITTTTTTSIGTTTTRSTTSISSSTQSPPSRIIFIILTIDCLRYHRIGGGSSNYFYVAIRITISISDNYTFKSSGAFAMYCFLYINSFNPNQPSVNLVAQGHNSAGNELTQFTTFLPAGGTRSKRKRATTTYILVSTTENPDVTGESSIIISGSSATTIITSDNETIIISNNNNDNDDGNDAKIGGIIAGSVVGGVLLLICLCSLCVFGICSWFYCFKGTPIRSNKAYVHDGFGIQSEIGSTIFRPSSFAGFFSKDDAWHGPYHLILSFYPQADHTVYGKGTDHLGTFVATGVYSPRTLRMAFDKRYQSVLGNDAQSAGQTMTIQVTWNHKNQSFEGKYYSKAGKHREEQRYMIQITNAKYRHYT